LTMFNTALKSGHLSPCPRFMAAGYRSTFDCLPWKFLRKNLVAGAGWGQQSLLGGSLLNPTKNQIFLLLFSLCLCPLPILCIGCGIWWQGTQSYSKCSDCGINSSRKIWLECVLFYVYTINLWNEIYYNQKMNYHPYFPTCSRQYLWSTLMKHSNNLWESDWKTIFMGSMMMLQNHKECNHH
jgi:hypothetical protein